MEKFSVLELIFMKYFIRLLLCLSLILCFSALISAQTSTGVKTIELPVAFSPTTENQIVFSPNSDTAYVAAFHTDRLFALRLSDGQMLSSIATGDGPGQLALFEQDNRRLLAIVNNEFIGAPAPTISIVDATNPNQLKFKTNIQLTDSIGLTGSEKTLIFSADGKKLLIVGRTSSNESLLLQYSTDNGELLKKLSLGQNIVAFNSIAINKNGTSNLLLLCGGSKPTLFLIDATNDLRLDTSIPLPGNIGLVRENNLVTDNENNFVYFAAADAGRLFAFDVTQKRLISQTATGTFPRQVSLVDLGDQEVLAVTAVFDGSVNIYNLHQGQVTPLTSFQSPSQFLTGAPLLKSNGQEGFVSDETNSVVYRFNAATGQKIETTNLNFAPANLQLTPTTTGDKITILDLNSEQIAIYLANNSLTQAARFSAPGTVFSLNQNFVLSKTRNQLFIASPSSNELLVLDASDGHITNRIAVGNRPGRVAMAEIGSEVRIAVINTGTPSVSLINFNSTLIQLTGEVPLPANASNLELANIVFSRDGQVGYIGDGFGQLIAFNSRSGEIVSSLNIGSQPLGLDIYENNNEQRLAILSTAPDGPAAVVIVNAATGKLEEIARYQAPTSQQFALNNRPVFSPDGRFIFITASFSLDLLSLDGKTGKLINKVTGINAVEPVPTNISGKLELFIANIGNSPLRTISVAKKGRIKIKKGRLNPPASSFFTVGNNVVINESKGTALITDYKSNRLLIFDIKTGKLIQTPLLSSGPTFSVLNEDGSQLQILTTNGSANIVNLVLF